VFSFLTCTAYKKIKKPSNGHTSAFTESYVMKVKFMYFST